MFSYYDLYNIGSVSGVGSDRHRFRSVARDGFNILDSEDTRFFKLLFYFNNDIPDVSPKRGNDEFEPGQANEATVRDGDWFLDGASGLLTPDWNRGMDNDYYKLNSAWGYLMNNNEWERATTLQKFVELLSSISVESPWYFQKISGLDEAMSRNNFKIDDERKKISIECLPDAMDHRIGSLLSMYRSIVWSHTRKCEVVPANLRKFDMGLFIYSGLTVGPHVHPGGEKGNTFDPWSWKGIYVNKNRLIHDDETPEEAYEEEWNDDTEDWDYESTGGTDYSNKIHVEDALETASYKYIEFHNCEFNIDSINSGMNDLNNADGFSQTFTIDIYFDDCYEQEYNQYILKLFGDLFLVDTAQSEYDFFVITNSFAGGAVDDELSSYKENTYNFNNYDKSLYPYGKPEAATKQSWIARAKQQLVDAGKGIVNNAVNQAKQAVRETADKALNVVGLGPWGGIDGQKGLGNFYRKSLLDIATKKLTDEASKLTSKAIGNIGDMATKLINTAANAIAKPVLGAISTVSSYIDAGINAVNNVVGGGIDTVTNIADHAVNKFVDNTVKAVTAPAEKLNNMTNDIRNDMSSFAKETNASVDKSLDNMFGVEKETMSSKPPKKSPKVTSLGNMKADEDDIDSSEDISLGAMVTEEELAERNAAIGLGKL